MPYNIHVTGYAPGGEPQARGHSSSEFTFQLSEMPDDDWSAVFRYQAEALMAQNGNIRYELHGDRFRITCPDSIIAMVASGAQKFVLGINGPADIREQDRARAAERAAKEEQARQARIANQSAKVEFAGPPKGKA